MKLKSLFGGRLEQWRWSRRRGELRQALLLLALVMSLVLLRNTEIHDLSTQHEALQAEANDLRRQLQFGDFASTTFVIDARTPDELETKLRLISNHLDKERALLIEHRMQKLDKERKK